MFPIKKKQISEKRMQNPWLTSGLINSIDNSHKNYKLYCKNLISKEFYVSYRNKVNKLIHSSKCRFFKNKFDNIMGDIKATWKTINSLLNKNKSKFNNSKQKLNNNGSKKANEFCDHFSNVATNLANDIKKTDVDFQSFMSNSPSCNFFIRPTTHQEVFNTINGFKSKGSSVDDIPAKVFKMASPELSYVVSKLFNDSLEQCIFLSCFKIARVIPLFKGGNTDVLDNYRPISILPFLSKVFEKLLLIRLVDFVKSFDILFNKQFGFRSGLSTSDALIEFMCDVYKSIDNDEYVISTFIDFKKAFDTVSHNILLSKLDYYGIRGHANKFI